jgi:hypothetical protein
VRLAIVGSTRFAHPDALHIARLIILYKLEVFEPDCVISGGAEGIDSLADECATGMGVPTLIHRPKNQRWKPEGFEDRNRLIAEGCTHLLAIRCHRFGKNNRWMSHCAGSTYGSGWTADEAERLGKVVERIVL